MFLLIFSGCIFLGPYTCDDSRIRPTDAKQSHWGAPQGSHSPFPPSGAPMVHYSILHHQAPPAGESTYDTLSLESSDSVETSVSTGNNSACSPERWDTVVKGTLRSASIPLTTGHAPQFPHKCFFSSSFSQNRSWVVSMTTHTPTQRDALFFSSSKFGLVPRQNEHRMSF